MKLNELAQKYMAALRREEAALDDAQKEELPSYREIAGAEIVRRIRALKVGIVGQLSPEHKVIIFDELRAEIDKDNPR